MMRNAKRAAEHAIRELAARPFVFSAHEVAALADLARGAPAVDEALRMRCLKRDIVLLDGARTGRRRFLGRDPALRWWCRYTARLAQLGINRLSPAQLRAAMALAFDRRGWDALPVNLLDIGRQAGLARAGAAGSIAFPWTVVLRTNPECLEAFEMMFFHQAPPDDLRGLTLDTILDGALAQLTEREGDVMRKRHGLDGARATLAQLGGDHHVTRERVRQIQRKASMKMARPGIQRRLWWAFVADFMQGGNSLVIPDSQLTPKRRFLHSMIRLESTPVPELEVHIIGPARDLEAYLKLLRGDPYGEAADANGPCAAAADALTFLPARDRQRLAAREQQRREARAAKSVSRMLQKALRALGRAAHYTEIAQTCNRLFPENGRPTRNWHAALSLCAKSGNEKFGIVWIGVHGKYGLKEHGYSRPSEGLHEAVPRIVRAQFDKTRRPVPLERVLVELSKQRREFNPGSVTMALSFSDKIEKANGGYLPAAPQDAGTESKYDISAAMRAFAADRREADDG